MMLGSNVGLVVLLYAVPPVLLFLMVAQYLALRVRDTRATPPDPHLGRKAACYFFVNAAVVMVLIGLTISSADVMEYLFEPLVTAQQAQQNNALPTFPSGGLAAPPPAPPPRDWFNDHQRLAAGLVASGLLHGLLFVAVARFATNDREFPAVRRSFVGLRFVVCGLVVMATTTVTIVGALQEGDADWQAVQMICSVAVVWGPAAALHLALLLWSSGWRRKRPAADDGDE